ncbi:McrC family protein [Macrococcus equi]|uniref:McrC family protein n=1 Tax=Macrococcus equi TaxID=3395462 RepID=UPI0039BE98B9
MNRKIAVVEFQRIVANSDINGVKITPEDIEQLNQFNFKNEGSKFDDFINPIKNGVQFKNYIGVLTTKTGLTIEILPKIYGTNSLDESKKLALEMIENSLKVSGKLFDASNMQVGNNNLIEIFIDMFLKEVKSICDRGLVSDYLTVEENNNFLKGKLMFSKHIKYNSVNRSRFYTEYSEYAVDNEPNRLIKKALIYLSNKQNSARINKKINDLLIFFEKVNHHILKSDSFVDNINRKFAYYENGLKWARLILNNISFQTYSGNHFSFAFLFPMEKLYEEYVYMKLKNSQPTCISILAQESKYSLFNKRNDKEYNKYRLKPDLVVRSQTDNEVIIMDTKWKILKKEGPTQVDLYQMYAYFTRYKQFNEKVKKVVLLYPYTDSFQPTTFKSLNYQQDNEVVIEVAFINFFEEDWIQKLWYNILENKGQYIENE